MGKRLPRQIRTGGPKWLLVAITSYYLQELVVGDEDEGADDCNDNRGPVHILGPLNQALQSLEREQDYGANHGIAGHRLSIFRIDYVSAPPFCLSRSVGLTLNS